MSEPGYETVELRLAEAGSELWQAVEAGQYARVIQPAEPENDAEADAMARFVETFTDCTEGWEAMAEADRQAALAGLGGQLEALERCGLFVHWAAVTRRFAAPGEGEVELPLAIVTISRTAAPAASMLLPTDLGIGSEGSGTSH